VRRAASRAKLPLRRRDGRRRGAPVPDRALLADASIFEGSAEAFEETVAPWTEELRWPAGVVYNGWFESVDAELYHAMLRTHRPARVVEIGGGYSTGFAARALGLNGGGVLTVVDPAHRQSLLHGTRHLALRAQDADPELFRRLRANDVLFIDSSHTEDEARHHVDRILPTLAPGVLVHHHDFSFPYDVDRFPEGRVLLDHYRAARDRYEVLVCASHVRNEHPEMLERLVPSYSVLAPHVIPGSLWARVRARRGNPAGTGP